MSATKLEVPTGSIIDRSLEKVIKVGLRYSKDHFCVYYLPEIKCYSLEQSRPTDVKIFEFANNSGSFIISEASSEPIEVVL